MHRSCGARRRSTRPVGARRSRLAFMCGLPLATRYPDVRPLAAPVTAHRRRAIARRIARSGSSAPTARSIRSSRRSVIGSAGPSSIRIRASTRRGMRCSRIGRQTRPRLYRESVGPLGHPRAALAALAEGRIDVNGDRCVLVVAAAAPRPRRHRTGSRHRRNGCRADAAAHLRRRSRPVVGRPDSSPRWKALHEIHKRGDAPRGARHQALRAGRARRLRTARRVGATRVQRGLPGAGLGVTTPGTSAVRHRGNC